MMDAPAGRALSLARRRRAALACTPSAVGAGI